MAVRIGINGFGRIGRNVFRAIDEDPLFSDIEVVAINDLTDNDTLAHLLKYDSVMGTLSQEIASDEEGISIDGRRIAVSSHRDPADIPWGDLGVDYVAECTGIFRDLESAWNYVNALINQGEYEEGP